MNLTERQIEELRRHAFAIAYRMLGSVADAEDIVQDALLRLHNAMTGGVQIESPVAYVSKITTRVAIDHLRSARVRRETYRGEWLPEPLASTDNPLDTVELAESISVAVLVLLENLSAEQRAAFLLHDVFGYPYGDVAQVIGTTEANARQLVSRARRHVRDGRPRFEALPQARDELARRFFDAVEHGDIEELELLLADGVVLHGDGGGKVPALSSPLQGRHRVAATIFAWHQQTLAAGRATLRITRINGELGAIALDADGRVFGVMSLDIADGAVRSVFSVVNPEKLRHLGPTGNLRSVLHPT